MCKSLSWTIGCHPRIHRPLKVNSKLGSCKAPFELLDWWLKTVGLVTESWLHVSPCLNYWIEIQQSRLNFQWSYINSFIMCIYGSLARYIPCKCAQVIWPISMLTDLLWYFELYRTLSPIDLDSLYQLSFNFHKDFTLLRKNKNNSSTPSIQNLHT